jgi:hypothetical protein
MLFSRSIIRSMVLGVALCLLTVSGSSRAEPSALDEKGSSAEAEKPAKDQPKEKKPITVPAGTSMMVKTGTEVSSKDKPGRKFSATLEANLLAGDEVVAKAGTQVYGQVISSKTVGRGVVMQHSDLVLGLTDINVEGTMYPIQTSSFSEKSTGVILQRRSVVIPAGSLLEFKLTQPLTVKK